MDRISGLPDDLLVKILYSLPTKVAVSTSLLSRRWQFLWMWLPKLNYDSPHPALEDFINKTLPLHKALIIESFRLDLRASPYCIVNSSDPEDNIKRWVGIAVSHNVSELEIIDGLEEYDNVFPSSLYTCKSLLTLKLDDVTLKRVPSTACLPSLKTLELQSVRYEESLQNFLSICPVLEDLSVDFFEGRDEMEEFTIIVPTLQSLSLYILADWFLNGYKIDTPSLKYFQLDDRIKLEHYCEIKNMPKLFQAYVDVPFHNLGSVIGSITSVEHITIHSKSLKLGGEDVNGDSFVFSELTYLDLKWSGSRNPLSRRLDDDDDALAIAKTIPELSHLQLSVSGNKITNTWLTAILDNFPHLKDLDLSNCSNVNLSGELEKRCLEESIHRLPKDSSTDCPSHSIFSDSDSEEEAKEEEEEEEEESEDE